MEPHKELRQFQGHDLIPVEAAATSRTHQYRKVMKPLLERKRRARINKCLDDLKDLMVYALKTEGDAKLEKADILELTVRHMEKLKAQNALGLTPQATYAGKFRAGYSRCAQEVINFVSECPREQSSVHDRLVSHLSQCVHALESLPSSAAVVPAVSPPAEPALRYPEPELEKALDLSKKPFSE